MATSTQQIVINNDLSQLPSLLNAVCRQGRAAGLSDEALYDVRLALEETVANIIHYAFPAQNCHRIRVCASLSPDHIRLNIEDNGKPFDPSAPPPIDMTTPFDERDPGGLGLFLVHHVMDQVSYRRIDGTNILDMQKHMDAAATKPARQTAP